METKSELNSDPTSTDDDLNSACSSCIFFFNFLFSNQYDCKVSFILCGDINNIGALSLAGILYDAVFR